MSPSASQTSLPIPQPSRNSPAPRFLSPRPQSSHLQPTGSSSPHHPGLGGSSSYPMSQSRSVGTPTSDVRGTSPTMANRDHELDESTLDPKLGDMTADTLGSRVFSAAADVAVEPKAVPGYPLGATRCYWSVLDDELRFVYVDPILQHHMKGESAKLLGTSIYDYIHPDERQQAMVDLEKSANNHPGQPSSKAMEAKGSGTSAVSSRASSSGPGAAAAAAGSPGGVKRRWEYGGVTRCRFARSSHIRRLLGAAAPETDPEADQYAIDDEFMSLKMVMSSIGINLVLCFFHAAHDKDPIADNRESEPRSSWTNWCGPTGSDPTDAYFTPAQASQLEAALLGAQKAAGVADATEPSTAPKPPAHVFQILKSSNGNILFSYPPPRAATEAKDDKPRYTPDEYSALAMDVCRRPKETNVAAKTNCTRRLKSRHPVMKDGNLMSIESVVIQYGSIIFAFFSTGGVFSSRTNPSTTRPGEPLSAPGGRKRLRTGSSQAAGGHAVQPQHHQNAFQQHQNQTSALLNDSALQSLVTMPWAHDSFAGAPSAAPATSMGTGDLSPTLASAASVLGSFQNATYSPAMQPVGLPTDDIEVPANPEGQEGQSGDGSGGGGGGGGEYGAYNLQHLAAMAMGEMGVGSADVDVGDGDRNGSPGGDERQSPSAAHAGRAPKAARQTKPRKNKPPPSGPMPPVGSERIPHVRQQRAHAAHHGHSASVDQAAQSLLGIGQGFEFPNSGAGGGAGGRKPSRSRSPAQGGDDDFAEFNKPAVNAQGLKACSSCGTTNSPEWRKGPSGIKSLCNACGLRFSRAMARKAKLAKAAEAKKNGLPPPMPAPKQPKKPKGAKGGRGAGASSAAAGLDASSSSSPGPYPSVLGGGGASSSMVDSIPVPASTSPSAYDYGAGAHESNVPWATDPAESPGPDDGGVGGGYMVGV